jgi:hypothetical protein
MRQALQLEGREGRGDGADGEGDEVLVEMDATDISSMIEGALCFDDGGDEEEDRDEEGESGDDGGGRDEGSSVSASAPTPPSS